MKFPFYKIYRAAAILCALFLLFPVPPASSNDDRDASLEILNRWTSIRWGEDNLAWVVYYPEELVDPWVRAEAEKRRLRSDQADAFKKAFVDELKIGAATPILLSVHVFGPTPLDLSPLANNIALVDSSGKRYSPIVIEKKLDSPLSGLVQGFVYFPKIDDPNFSVLVKGLIPDRETHFTFSGSGIAPGSIATTTGGANLSVPPVEQTEEVIVRIPTTPPEGKKTPEPPQDPNISTEAEVFQPTMPPIEEPELPQDFPAHIQDEQLPQEPMLPQTGPRLAPKQVLDIYLKAWVSGDTERMYSLLSTESQGRISRELFEREVTTGGFRNLLKSGYKVTWTGEETAKVTVARRILLVRTLESKNINFVEEDGSARVSW